VTAMEKILARVFHYARLMRMHRPVGSLLLLWPTLWALWIAGDGAPRARHLLVFVAGVFVMRAAGCVANDIADRDIDRHVARTRGRPLANGDVTVREAAALLVALCAAAFLLALQLNFLTLLLAAAGLAVAAVYPLCKRFTHLPQAVLGVAFSWGIPMAFAAERGALPAAALLLAAANFCWVMAYDTMYAMADREDDLRIGVKSTAILFGARDRLLVAVFHTAALALLALLGAHLQFHTGYFAALALAAAFAIYQMCLCRNRAPPDCHAAFTNNIWFGGAVFFGVALAYLD